MPSKVLVADDQPVARAGLRLFLERTSCQIVAEVTTSQELKACLKRKKVDLVLLGAPLGEDLTLKTLRYFKEVKPTQSVLVWPHHHNLTNMVRSRALGACGYLSRDADRKETLEAIQRAASGKSVWTEEQLKLADPRKKPTDQEIPLTQREYDVVSQLVHGLPNQEIAWALGNSRETIKEHIQTILRKLGVRDRTEAAAIILRRGWI